MDLYFLFAVDFSEENDSNLMREKRTFGDEETEQQKMRGEKIGSRELKKTKKSGFSLFRNDSKVRRRRLGFPFRGEKPQVRIIVASLM